MSRWFKKESQRAWQSRISEGQAPALPSVTKSFQREQADPSWGVRVVPPAAGKKVDLPAGSFLHVSAQYLAEGRAQVAEYAASASAAIREMLAEARARRFEAVQQAKARRLMLESYREALKRHADAQRILGPHVRFSEGTGKNLWIMLFLIGDAAGMTLALTYGGESPIVAAIMALAVGAAVVVCGKTGEDLRHESLVKNLDTSPEPEVKRFVDAVFGIQEQSTRLNRRVLYSFAIISTLAGAAVSTYRTYEESFGVGIAFGLWAMLIGGGSFAASWYYYDPAKTYITLTKNAVDDAEAIWNDTPIDAIEVHNSTIESARHIVAEHRSRAEAAWNMTLAGAVAAMAANSEVIGIYQTAENTLLNMHMPPVQWPSFESYMEIVDRDDVDATDEGWAIFAEDGTNQTTRPVLLPAPLEA
jgi:hypothetical protein